jgi:hypothetical protein
VRALLIAAAVAAPSVAHAWTLDYDVAPDCADAEAFRARVETQRLHTGDVDVRVHVTVIALDGTRWSARVEIGPTGARELAGASCSEVHDAAILIVAQLLDGATRPVIVPAVAPRAMTPVPGVDDASPPRPPDPPVTIRVGGGFGADARGMASPSAGARLTLDAGWQRAVLAFGATRWLEVTDLDAEGQGLSMSSWQVHAAARLRVARRLEVGAQFEIGELSARGRGVDTILADTGAWQAIGATARIGLWRWRRLEVAADVELLVPIGTTTFVVDGEPRYRTGTTIRGFVGAVWRIL